MIDLAIIAFLLLVKIMAVFGIFATLKELPWRKAWGSLVVAPACDECGCRLGTNPDHCMNFREWIR